MKYRNQPVLFADMHDRTLMRGCDNCSLRGHSIVKGAGPLRSSELLILGERPGHNEVEQCIPFVGGSGQYLMARLWNVIRRKRKDIRIENAVRCMPPSNKKVDEEMRWACSLYFENIIKQMPNLKVILALGGIAFNTLLHQYGKQQYMISHARGRVWVWQDRVHIVPTYHPAYLLRPGNHQLAGDFSIDLQRAKSLLSAPLPDSGDVLYIERRSLAEGLLRRILAREKAVAVDVEAYLPDGITARRSASSILLTLALSVDNGDNAIVLGAKLLNEASIKRLLRKVFKQIPIIGQNFNGFDRDFLRRLLGDCASCRYDTMYGSYIYDEARGIHNLNMIAARFGYYGGYDWKLIRYLKRHALTKSDMHKVPLRLLAEYNGRDVIANHRAFKTQSKSFSSDFIRLTNFLTKCSEVTEEYERNGVGIDLATSHELEAMFKVQAEKHACLARLAVNKPKLMLTSDHQVRQLLYDELCLHKIAKWDRLKSREARQFKTKSGNSWAVDEKTLMHLDVATGHKFMKHLLDFRANQNAIDDHVLSIRKLISDDGRIHCTSFLHGTRTGRISMRLHSLKHVYECRCVTKCKKCDHPQDIMWNMFKARDGHQFIKADYSQLEMRIMAELSGDEELVGIYEKGEDFHNETQQIIYADLYTSRNDETQRRVSKNANFGTAYGLDKEGLYIFLAGKIRDFSLTFDQVSEFHDEFYKRFHTLREWQLGVIAFMQKHGYVVTWSGRTRAIDPSEGKHADNQSVNTIIQSSAHEVLLVAGLEYFHHRRRKGLLIMEHHDALIVEVADKFVCAEATLLERLMLNPPTDLYFGPQRKLKIPLKVDIKIGPTLGNMNEIPF